MRSIRYGVAASLDGFIAGPNGEVDWITLDPEVDFAEIWAQFDTLLMGRCGGLHARCRSARVVAGCGLPRHSLQRPVGGLSDVPFRPDAVMLGPSEEEHPGDCRLCAQPLGNPQDVPLQMGPA